MKRKTPLFGQSVHFLKHGLLGLVLMGTATIGQAQVTNYLIDQFDTDTSSLYRNQWWGTVAPTVQWDGAVNQATSLGPNTDGSGSAYWTADWSSSNGSDQFMVFRWLGQVLDLRNYTNISFDIRFDPTSATDGKGGYGGIEIDWSPSSDGWPSTPLAVAYFYVTNGNWVHVSLPVDANANAKLRSVNGIGFKMQQNKTGGSLTGVTAFWLDNLILGVRTTQVAPPSLALKPVTTPPGLMMFANGGGNEYNRAVLRTISGSYSWVGYGDSPMTFATTIASYPDNNHSGFQSVIFLVPGTANDPAIDWDAANVVELVIQNNSDGTATGSFQYKTNQAQGNAMFGGLGHLADIRCSTPLGRWSITFLNDTNVTMSGPGGLSTNFNFPDVEMLQTLFQNPVSAYFGNQQGGANNAGQAATYSKFEITGAIYSTDISDTFTNLDRSVWQPLYSQSRSDMIIDGTAKYWVSWSLPDTGFSLRSSPDLSAGSWGDPGYTNLITTTVGNRVLVTTDKLPAPEKGFFRMVK